MSQPLAQRYDIGQRRGVGPVGAVYRAVDRQTGQPVAVKVLNPRFAADARMIAAFTARTPPGSAALLPVLDCAEANGYLYRVTAWVEGPNLAEWLTSRREPPGLEHLTALVKQIAAALPEGRAHGNLKPSNILLEAGGRVRLSDAGLPSPPGPYSAPEGASTPQADVFSLGMILGEILGSAAPSPVRQVLARAVQPDPKRRYPSLDAFAAAWQAAVTGQPVPAPAQRTAAAAKPPALPASVLIGAVAIGIVVFAVLLLASSRGGQAGGGQLQAAAMTATALIANLPSATPYTRPTLPPSWTPQPVEVASKTPEPSNTPRPTAYPTISANQLALTYWNGDGYDSTMWDALFSDGTYGRFDLFPVNVWMSGYGSVSVNLEHEAALQNALAQISQVVPIARVENRLFAHLTIWLMTDADFRTNAACGPEHDYAIACALPTYTDAGILLVTIWMDAADRCFAETLLHEMTHGLGIIVHSPEPADIMYYAQTCSMTAYSQRDLATLRLLYSQPAFHPNR